MNNPRQLPAQLKQQVEAALREGRPLPPGIVALPRGQAPPQGAVPMGVTAPVVAGQGMQQPHPAMQQKMAQNPLPDGEDLVKTLRSMSECPIPQESAQLNQLLQILIAKDGDETHIEQTLATGLVVALRANKYCKSNLSKRTVVRFKDDPKLNDLHTRITGMEAKAEALQKELQALAEEGQKLLAERWQYAVQSSGLNPAGISYYIDEEAGTIESVELRCDQCKGAVTIQEARKKVGELLKNLEEEQNND